MHEHSLFASDRTGHGNLDACHSSGSVYSVRHSETRGTQSYLLPRESPSTSGHGGIGSIQCEAYLILGPYALDERDHRRDRHRCSAPVASEHTCQYRSRDRNLHGACTDRSPLTHPQLMYACRASAATKGSIACSTVLLPFHYLAGRFVAS